MSLHRGGEQLENNGKYLRVSLASTLDSKGKYLVAWQQLDSKGQYLRAWQHLDSKGKYLRAWQHLDSKGKWLRAAIPRLQQTHKLRRLEAGLNIRRSSVLI